MKPSFATRALLLLLVPAVYAQNNTLSPKEKAAGWRLLWDGNSMHGWHSAKGADVPVDGAEIKDGVLHLRSSESHQGDVVSDDIFGDFELTVDFKLTRGANSGVKYFVNDKVNEAAKSVIGFEYQLLDDDVHPDAKLGRNGDRKTASLYDILPAAENQPTRPIGEWNTARIVVRGNHAEHWLNGVKVLEYDRTSPTFREALAQSKFKDFKGFGDASDGHILLQDHGDVVYFRNIKIRPLTAHSK
ncbi:MAG: DUF1080 domain-containing protein [Acidobacteriaceae bacterium]|nr:DUF1080 domain-containing protein [Acidobacteriaceae bacterium]